MENNILGWVLIKNQQNIGNYSKLNNKTIVLEKQNTSVSLT